MKKMILFSALALCASGSCQAQFSTAKYGIYAQVGYAKPNDGFLNEWIETPQVSYSLGMSVRQQLSPRWKLSTGVALTYSKYDTYAPPMDDVTHPSYPLQDFGGWNCLPLFQTNLYAYNKEYGVEIPLMMQYYIARDRFFISSGLEMNAGMYMRQKAAYLGYSGAVTHVDKAQHITNYQVSIPLGCGINIPVSQRHLLSIEPGIRIVAAEYQTYAGYKGSYTFRTSFFF